MKLHGRLIKDTKTIREASVENSDESLPFRDALEYCFINLCKELDVQVPLWLRKNTSGFGAYHRTFFFKDQFLEKVKFDRFEIRID